MNTVENKVYVHCHLTCYKAIASKVQGAPTLMQKYDGREQKREKG